MKGAAQFYSDMLIEEPTHHWLVIAPANSPENHFELPDGQQAAISPGINLSMRRSCAILFTACIESSKILGIDKDFRNKLIAKRARLAPMQIGPDGRDHGMAANHTRNRTRIIATSRIFGDCIRAMKFRLIPRRNWRRPPAKLWKCAAMTAWAGRWLTRRCCGRGLDDGNHAWLLVQKALDPAYGMEHPLRWRRRCLSQFVRRLLRRFKLMAISAPRRPLRKCWLQSQEGVIHLLPALPGAWKEGKVTGLCARGDFEVGLVWNDGHLISATIRSNAGEPCRCQLSGQNG